MLEKRAKENLDVDLVNEYQPGDFVLFKPNPRSKAHKLVPTLLGPYRVQSQDRGEVFCHQVATGVARQFHITRLYPFVGTEEEAFQLACRDSDQYSVRGILGYRGDPVAQRRYMTFLVEFADGDKTWCQYGPDLVSNTIFQDYVHRIPELMLLRSTALEAGRYVQRARQLAIPMTVAPDHFLVDLRVLGFTWYDELQLPNADISLYLLEAKFVEHTNKNRTRAKVYFPALDESLAGLDYAWFEMNATRIFLPPDSIFVDELFLVKFPQVLGEANKERQRTLERLFSPVIAGTPANRRGLFRAGIDNTSSNEKVILPRPIPRVQRDEHVPNIRDGNRIDPERRILREPTSSETPILDKTLVRPVTSRRYAPDIPVVDTGVRTGLRRRDTKK